MPIFSIAATKTCPLARSHSRNNPQTSWGPCSRLPQTYTMLGFLIFMVFISMVDVHVALASAPQLAAPGYILHDLHCAAPPLIPQRATSYHPFIHHAFFVFAYSHHTVMHSDPHHASHRYPNRSDAAHPTPQCESSGAVRPDHPLTTTHNVFVRTRPPPPNKRRDLRCQCPISGGERFGREVRSKHCTRRQAGHVNGGAKAQKAHSRDPIPPVIPSLTVSHRSPTTHKTPQLYDPMMKKSEIATTLAFAAPRIAIYPSHERWHNKSAYPETNRDVFQT